MENSQKMGSNFEKQKKKTNINKTVVKVFFVAPAVLKYYHEALRSLPRNGLIEISRFS